MPARQRSARHQRIIDLFDRHDGVGLEIGPLYDPVVHRDEADVRYVDVHPGDVLREYYSAHPGVPVDKIVDPDFVIIGPDGARSLPVAVGDAAPFRWAVASHVIEHVPDVVGWLREVAELLEDDGRLVLAVPDRRFSFDAARDATTVGQMLQAHRDADTMPSARAIHDHYRYVVSIQSADAWAGQQPTLADRIHGIDFVLEQLALADKGTYVDCHVWLFTPQSFVDQLAELGELDLVDFTVEQIVATRDPELEFYAVLRRLPRGLDRGGRDAARAATADLRGLDERPNPTAPDAPAEPPPLAAGTQRLVVSGREAQLIRAKRAAITRARRLLKR